MSAPEGSRFGAYPRIPRCSLRRVSGRKMCHAGGSRELPTALISLKASFDRGVINNRVVEVASSGSFSGAACQRMFRPS